MRVSTVSILWTLTSSVVAVALGTGAGSLVLVAFGLTGLLDAAGSATLVVHFRHALRHESFSERHERAAMRVVTAGLVTVAGLAGFEGTRRLLAGTEADAVPAGVVVAALSIVVLGLLARRKRRVAGRIPSRALLADAWLSATGCGLAVVTVAGTALLSADGWWWADPAAALGVACGALGIAVALTRSGGRPQ